MRRNSTLRLISTNGIYSTTVVLTVSRRVGSIPIRRDDFQIQVKYKVLCEGEPSYNYQYLYKSIHLGSRTECRRQFYLRRRSIL